jgi:Putative adhesin
MTTIAPPPLAPPAEPAPPPLTPRARTALRAVLVAVAAVLVAGLVVFLGVAAWGVSAVRVVADTKNLPVDMTSLVVNTGDVASAVRITTDRDTREPTITMRQVRSTRSAVHSLAVSEDAGATRVAVSGGGTTPFLPWDRAGELTVTLPADLARRLSVTVQQQDGVLLAQADLDQLTARNTDGAVVLDGSARRVELHTTDGRVVTRRPSSVSESFRADSVDGDVSADFADAAPRTIDVDTNDGDVAIALPAAGPYLVHASGDSTQVRAPQTNDPERAIGQVTVSVQDGNVTITTPDSGPPPSR